MGVYGKTYGDSKQQAKQQEIFISNKEKYNLLHDALVFFIKV